MPHKDPAAAKAYWERYRNSDAGRAKRQRWNETRRQRMEESEWRNQRYDANLRRLYGITIQTYQEMHEHQKGACAICLAHQSSLPQRLSVDHCHKTGRVRGLLCRDCNHGIGKLKDSSDVISRALAYVSDTVDARQGSVGTQTWGKPISRRGVNDPLRLAAE